DLSAWREKVRNAIATANKPIFASESEAAWVYKKIAGRGRVEVFPAIFCADESSEFGSPEDLAAMAVQLMAARANAAMPAVYLSRGKLECPQLAPETLAQHASDRVVVLLSRPD